MRHTMWLKLRRPRVPEKDPEALAEAIASLRASPERRAALSSSARARAADAFSWHKVGERFESVLRSVAQARQKAS